jgi:hypothetical protein
MGKQEFTETLSPDPGKARRMIQAHIIETDRILELAKSGNWPEITDDEIEAVAIGWWTQWREIANALSGSPTDQTTYSAP